MDLSYQFSWPGKLDAIKEASKQTNKKFVSIDKSKAKNYCINADNLDALKILKSRYPSSIKCIYIDPPYNTGNKFAYNDDF